MSVPDQWAAHPSQEGMRVHVNPMLRTMLQFEAPDNASIGAGAGLVIHRVLRVLNVTAHDPIITPPDKLASLYEDLHRMQDMFAELVVEPVEPQ